MTDASINHSALDREALAMHRSGRPGKLEIRATKPLTSQHDLSLAYSPGVAAPCLEIQANADTAYDYTAKGNLVAIISNGTAVLGLGNLGALASKPVMEGKAVLFKRFADVDGIDLELATEDVDAFVEAVKLVAPSFGGINLEDIKAPEAFQIEARLQEEVDIPVMHDDQHGTAIIAAAGLINAMDLTGRDLKTAKIVALGAGAASIATMDLLKAMGVPHGNVTMVDSKGVIYQGRQESMNQWKSAHAIKTDTRTLEEAIKGADVFFGLAAANSVSRDMVASMAKKPIIFAMANPTPEILPEEVLAVRDDAIIATGRSDYPNQVNNVLGFPYIFRGALDVRATAITMNMKIAAVHAIAELAREDVPDEVGAAYGKRLKYGPDYIIPAPFDPRLIVKIPKAVAAAAIKDGVAKQPIEDWEAYERNLSARLDPTSAALEDLFEQVRANPKRAVFAEGEEERVIRAAVAYSNAGFGQATVIGREQKIKTVMEDIGIDGSELTIMNASLSRDRNQVYADHLYQRNNRKGMLERDAMRLVTTDRNIYGACMVAAGDGDVFVTGLTRGFHDAHTDLRQVMDAAKDQLIIGYNIFVSRGRTILIGDTTIHPRPSGKELALIACQLAARARALGHEPRVAVISYSTFGNAPTEVSQPTVEAIAELDKMDLDFEYDGEMQVDVALDYDLMQSRYPFCRLTGPANILLMPGLHSANNSAKLLRIFGDGVMIGPIMDGLEHAAQVLPMGCGVNDLVNAAAIGAVEVEHKR